MTVSRRSLLALATAALTTGALAACADGYWDEKPVPGEGGYIEGDGSWSEYPIESRQTPISYSGTTEHGDTIDSATLLGRVVVVNFWYAACPPCRLEAPDLQAAWVEHQPQDVQFVGVNIYDQAPTVQSFNENFGITFPSILDVDSAAVRLAFAASVPPQAIPSTLVIDKQGRVASVIRGPVNASVLRTMIQTAVAEAA